MIAGYVIHFYGPGGENEPPIATFDIMKSLEGGGINVENISRTVATIGDETHGIVTNTTVDVRSRGENSGLASVGGTRTDEDAQNLPLWAAVPAPEE